MNLMGKGNTVAGRSTDGERRHHSMVFGDNHRKSYLDQPKIGHAEIRHAYWPGTAMPEGHINRLMRSDP